jgi:uncharacterized protein YdeI (BOF family)
VKKSISLLTLLLMGGALFVLISMGGVAHAQPITPSAQQAPAQAAPPQQTPPPSSQQPPSQAEPPSQQPGQTPDQAGRTQGQAQSDSANGHEFVGTIMKQGNKYMFQDSSSGQTYDIDHQDEVKKFDGKKVRVRGTLDPQTKTIHVQ